MNFKGFGGEIMKHVAFVVFSLFVLFSATAETSVKLEYSIGAKGPAGGYVFYINATSEQDGWRYLEAAPADLSGGIEWGDNYKISNPADIGSGYENTDKIIAIQGEGLINGKGPYAAKICKDYSLNQFDDWYLL